MTLRATYRNTDDHTDVRVLDIELPDYDQAFERARGETRAGEQLIHVMSIDD